MVEDALPPASYRLEEIRREGVIYWHSKGMLEESGAMVVFTSRIGGESRGRYAGLNLSYHVGDDPSSVDANRRKVAGLCGFDVRDYTFCKQVHGVDVAPVGVYEAGRGCSDYDSAIDGCDGLVTGSADPVLGVLVADCLPILLVDGLGRGVAALHAGWRGTLGGIASRGVSALCELVGAEPRELVAFLGPSLCARCLELDRKAVESVESVVDDEFLKWDVEGRRCHLDLPGVNRKMLLDEGLGGDRILHLDMCTRCSGGKLYSYRGFDGITGRQAALVSLRG